MQVPLGLIMEVSSNEDTRVTHRIVSQAAIPALATPSRTVKTVKGSRDITLKCRDFRTIKLIFTENCSEPYSDFGRPSARLASTHPAQPARCCGASSTPLQTALSSLSRTSSARSRLYSLAAVAFVTQRSPQAGTCTTRTAKWSARASTTR